MIKRNIPRLPCSIEAFACTPVEVRAARIIDLSHAGAKVLLDRPFEVGRRIHLDVAGDFYWATVMWSEVDRMGLRFHSPLAVGILVETLKQLSLPVRPERRVAAGFGRRGVR